MKFYEFLEVVREGAFHSDGKEVVHFTPEFQKGVMDIVPFAFTAIGGNAKVEPVKEGSFLLNLPFPKCFFEVLGGSITVLSDSEKGVSIEGIYVEEKSPREYEMGFLCRSALGYSIAFTEQRPVVEHMLGILRELLARLSREEVGIANPRKSFKMRIGSRKAMGRISKIVYVSPKKQIAETTAKVGKEIDWSHRWEVRGHWRTVTGGIGKDRDGNPIAGGYTWVRAHVRGPEEAPLVKKTRVVTGDQNETK